MLAASDLKGGFAWTDTLIRKLNGEAMKLSFNYFDKCYPKWGNSGGRGTEGISG